MAQYDVVVDVFGAIFRTACVVDKRGVLVKIFGILKDKHTCERRTTKWMVMRQTHCG